MLIGPCMVYRCCCSITFIEGSVCVQHLQLPVLCPGVALTWLSWTCPTTTAPYINKPIVVQYTPLYNLCRVHIKCISRSTRRDDLSVTNTNIARYHLVDVLGVYSLIEIFGFTAADFELAFFLQWLRVYTHLCSIDAGLH